jgi:hypothetical protein
VVGGSGYCYSITALTSGAESARSAVVTATIPTP